MQHTVYVPETPSNISQSQSSFGSVGCNNGLDLNNLSEDGLKDLVNAMEGV
jgi:hypothetical protein